MIKAYHVSSANNIASILTYGLIPSVGARSVAMGEESPAIFLFPSLDDLENALDNWLGSEIDDEIFALFEVIIPPHIESEVTTGYEISVYTTIPAEYITLLSDDVMSLASMNEFKYTNA